MSRGYSKVRFFGGNFIEGEIELSCRCLGGNQISIQIPVAVIKIKDKMLLFDFSDDPDFVNKNKNRIETKFYEVFEKELVIDGMTKYNFIHTRIENRCRANTKKGERCKNFVETPGNACRVHVINPTI